jgi:hypothetical protein
VCRCTTPGYSGDNCDKEGELPPASTDTHFLPIPAASFLQPALAQQPAVNCSKLSPSITLSPPPHSPPSCMPSHLLPQTSAAPVLTAASAAATVTVRRKPGPASAREILPAAAARGASVTEWCALRATAPVCGASVSVRTTGADPAVRLTCVLVSAVGITATAPWATASATLAGLAATAQKLVSLSGGSSAGSRDRLLYVASRVVSSSKAMQTLTERQLCVMQFFSRHT